MVSGTQRDHHHSSDLQCNVERIEYDFLRQLGVLRMPEANCCDMKGCIELFERIDPDVLRIETFAGGQPDTFYWRRASGRWEAGSP